MCVLYAYDRLWSGLLSVRILPWSAPVRGCSPFGAFSLHLHLHCLELPHVEPTPSPLTQWTRSPRTPVLHLRHDMSCLERYVRWIVSPSLRARKAQLLAAEIKKRARWRICAYLVATYRQSLHEDLLAARASSRHGLVCAHTRNAQRLRPKRGVNYDEKDRRPNRILPTETYRTHRWPLRDKCGPTLAIILYYLWGIT